MSQDHAGLASGHGACDVGQPPRVMVAADGISRTFGSGHTAVHAMPSGTELFIGFFDLGHIFFSDLIYTSSHTCSHAQQPPGTP